MTVTSGNADLGLLICRGWKRDSADAKPYLLYVEETKHQAYGIDAVSVSNTGGWFDEWGVYTCEHADTIAENGNSVI